MPETKQRSLEELEHVFDISTRRHAAFQLGEQLPWSFRKWILRRRGEPEPQLYHFPEQTESDQANNEGRKWSSTEVERRDI